MFAAYIAGFEPFEANSSAFKAAAACSFTSIVADQSSAWELDPVERATNYISATAAFD